MSPSTHTPKPLHAPLVDFLHQEEIFREHGLEVFHVNDGQAHGRVGRACLGYLLSYASRKEKCTAHTLNRHPLLEYACKYWPNHVRNHVALSRDSQVEAMGSAQTRIGTSFTHHDFDETGCSRKHIRRLFTNKDFIYTWLSIFDPEDPSKAALSPPRSATPLLSYAVATGIPDYVSESFSDGANVNEPNQYGRRPLHTAVKYGLVQILEELLDHGAIPTAKDVNGAIPLVEAAGSYNYELFPLLYKRTTEGELTRADTRETTVLHTIAMRGTSAAAEHMIRGRSGSLLLKRKEKHRKQMALIDMKDEDGCTLLHRAVAVGNIWTARVFLQHGADIDSVDNTGNTSLHFAIKIHQDASRDLLLDHGAIPTIKNKDKKTPLELSWASKSLGWAKYSEDVERSGKVSIGAQAACHVLRKKSGCDGPEVCLPSAVLFLRENLLPSSSYSVRRTPFRRNR